MSRQERQVQRLRGAGRTFVDNAPIAFKSRLSAETTLQSVAVITTKDCSEVTTGDIRIPLAVIESNVTTTKAGGKSMDFRTPKVARSTAIVLEPAETLRTEISMSKVATPLPMSRDETGGEWESPLQFSTPQTEPHDDLEIVQSILSAPIASVVKDKIVLHIDEPMQSPISTAPRPIISNLHKKRKSDVIDMQIAIKTSPEKRQKRKANGLLRELGPGASRFIIGGPNFATPARRQSIKFTKVAISKPARQARRRSERLLVQSPGHIPKCMTLTGKKSSQLRSKTEQQSKSCALCMGTRAWNRWHALDSDRWSCHKCHKISDRPVRKLNAMQPKKKGRVGIILDDNDLALVFARRRQGRTFDAIAKELRKWKTGQSVKNYVQKHINSADEKRLESVITGLLGQSTSPCRCP